MRRSGRLYLSADFEAQRRNVSTWFRRRLGRGSVHALCVDDWGPFRGCFILFTSAQELAHFESNEAGLTFRVELSRFGLGRC
jgi:hypothetical protein